MDLNDTQNVRHTTTTQCSKGVERKSYRLAAEYSREKLAMDFQAYVSPLETVTSFKYLGQIMTALDDN